MSDERRMTMDDRLARLRDEKASIEAFDADRALAPGQLTPRQRVEALVDPASFLELGSLARRLVFADPAADVPPEQAVSTLDAPADGIITGFATVGGRPLAVAAEDPRALSLTDAKVGIRKRDRLLDQAVYQQVPLVYVADGPAGGSPLLERELLGYRRPSYRDVSERSGLFVAAVLGPCHGTSSSLVAAADVVVATGSATGSVDADVVAPDDRAALDAVRRLVRLVPPRGEPVAPLPAAAPVATLDDDAPPAGPGLIVDALFDSGSVVELRSTPGLRTGLGAVDGIPLVFVLTGGEEPVTLGVSELRIVTRAVRIAHRYRLPLLTTQDCAGYDPEQVGGPALAEALADLLTLLRTLPAPQASIVTGEGFCVGDFPLGASGAGFDLTWAWPTATVHTHEAERAGGGPSPDGPWTAADLCLVDDVLFPSETRAWVGRLVALANAARAMPPAHYDRGMVLTDLV